MNTLYHYTCRHAAQHIRATGLIYPANHLNEALLSCRPFGYTHGHGQLAWFTDLPPTENPRLALGLTGIPGAVIFKDCDRTSEHDATTTTVWLSGGVAGVVYVIKLDES